ncbi:MULTISPECIES: SCO family protein [unclassified Pseudoalteromonas]|uniref:SCO family protein n=1 Tax=unclassified Pseudoalteromonas TaxID=194690 RepID=UPI002096AACD|nr:SCO family protein [Pseudoalteromonas sp. XMcav2-N]MCO7187523.1 SCO family protein [Pseudoalteromonas sp. XMcav2-N]
MHNKYALILTLFTGLGLGLVLPTTPPSQPVIVKNLMQETERSLKPFELQGAGSKFDKQSLQGKWTLIMFGFTHCPDICPTTLSRLAVLETHMSRLSNHQTLTYLFVSVDSGRDSIAMLDKYVRHFSPSFFSVTGHPEQLKSLAHNVGAQFQLDPKPDNYQVAHSALLYLTGPQGKLRARFNIDHNLIELAHQLHSVISRAESVKGVYVERSRVDSPL